MFDVNTDSIMPLSAHGVDFNNETQAGDFLGSLLDDTLLQRVGEKYVAYFWLGVIAVVLVTVVARLLEWIVRKSG